MAAEEAAKLEFCNILDRIGKKYEIIHTKWLDEKTFEAKFRTQVNRDTDDFNGLCDGWVDVFSDVTNTVWAKKISNTGPKIRFRKQYQCWTHGGKIVHKELLFDARRCKGTLDIKVLADDPLTRKRNKYIRAGLNVVVKINFMHLHNVNTDSSYAFFVHTCEPLPEAPKPNFQPNDRLPELVANMVQKGKKHTSKQRNNILTTTSTITTMQPLNNNNNNNNNDNNNCLKEAVLIDNNNELLLNRKNLTSLFGTDVLNLSEVVVEDPNQMQTVVPSLVSANIQHLVPQSVPTLQDLEAIKLDLPPHLQQYTQIVGVGDISSETLLMCQSLMYDTTAQIIPIAGNSLQTSHFMPHLN